MSKKVRRVYVTLSEETYSKLESLVKDMDCVSVADKIRSIIRNYLKNNVIDNVLTPIDSISTPITVKLETEDNKISSTYLVTKEAEINQSLPECVRDILDETLI